MHDEKPVGLPPTTELQRLARQAAQATGTFENMLLHRVPRAVSVVAADDWMVIHLQEEFDAVERRLVEAVDGRRRVEEFHRFLFENSLASLCSHVRRTTGIHLKGAVAHVDAETCTVLKTFSTHPAIDLFVLGQGLPGLGVPVNDHRHADRPKVAGSVRL